MALHVQSKVVRSGECPLAQATLERPVSRVLAVMPRQFIRASKPPAAAFPTAQVRLFSSVSSQVGLQVAGLGVGLAAGLVAARVDGHLLPAPASATPFLQGYRRCRVRKDEPVARVMKARRG